METVAPSSRRWFSLRGARGIGLGLALALVAGGAPAAAVPSGARALNRAFTAAAEEFRVPLPVLMAVSHAETRWEAPAGLPSFSGGYGVMHLQDHEGNRGLERAAAASGLAKAAVRADVAANVRAGAAFLAALYRESYPGDAAMARGGELERWFEPVARYLQSEEPAKGKDFAEHVFALLARGVSARWDDGTLTLPPQGTIEPDQGAFRSVPSRSERRALGWLDASSKASPQAPADAFTQSPNYDIRWRGLGSITKVVIHTCQGPFSNCINTFLNPASKVSAHYVVRSSDGYVRQMVYDKDWAWHAGSHNTYTVGIEHEGYVSSGWSWYTDTMYRESAWVTAYRLYYYNLTTNDIVAHAWLAGSTHTDPGPYWNWNVYRMYVQQDLDTLRRNCVPGSPC